MLTDPFVGREDVMRLLSAALDDAVAGSGRLLLLAGEPGMGKTRTAEEFVANARRRGVTVFWGRCYEDEGAPAFWPWVEILRATFRGRTTEQLRSTLEGAAEIAQLVPAVRENLPDLPVAIGSDSAEGRFRLFDAVATYFGRLSQEAPLLIVIDDLHGADSSSMRLLELLNRALRQMRVLILATYRNAEVRHERGLQQALVELAREPRTQCAELSGLTRDQVSQFVAAHARAPVSEALTALVYARSEGNPLFVGEFVRLLAAGGHLAQVTVPDSIATPQSVRAVIERRFGALSSACRRGLELAAVIGREFELRLLAMAAAAPPAHTVDVDAILEEAEANGIIGDSPQGTGHRRFTHALLRETLYDSLRIAERPLLHRRIAEAIEQQPRIDEYLTVLVYHYAEAARTVPTVEQADPALIDKVVAYGRRAAERAMIVHAYEEAVRLYQLALMWCERAHTVANVQSCALMVDLGIAHKAAGDTESCKATLLEAAARAEYLDQPEQLARAALHFGSSYLWGEGAAPDFVLVQLLERALSRLPPEDSSVRARLLARLAIALRFSDQHERRLAASDDALAMARRVEDRTAIAHALLAWHTASWTPDNLDKRLAVATELVEIATQLSHLELEIQGHACRFDDFMEAGNRLAADSELYRCERVAQQLRQPFYSWLVQLMRVMPLLLEGRFAEAELAMQAALSMGDGVCPGSSELFGVQMFMLYTTQRRREGFELMSQAMGARAAEFPVFPVFRIAVAYCAAHLGRESAARVEFDLLAAGGFSNLPRDHMHLLMLHQLAEVCAFLDDKLRAQELMALLRPYEMRPVTCVSAGGYLGPVSYYLALLETMLGQWEAAARHFEHAIDMNVRMRAQPWLAYGQYEYARMLLGRADGAADSARARELLNDALSTARDLGLGVLQEQVSAIECNVSRSTHDPAPDTQPPTPDLLFRCEGQFWTVAYAGQIVRIKDSKGLQYLAQLLARPGQEIPALDLAQSGRTAPDADEKLAVDNGGLVALDEQAKREYRGRWRELRRELAEAEELNDLGRAGKLKAELEFLTQQLNAAVDLHGRDRKTGATAERARLLVTKRIKSTVKSLDTLHPPLAYHLRACVKTGYYCAYTPPPGQAITWRTSD